MIFTKLMNHQYKFLVLVNSQDNNNKNFYLVNECQL